MPDGTQSREESRTNTSSDDYRRIEELQRKRQNRSRNVGEDEEEVAVVPQQHEPQKPRKKLVGQFTPDSELISEVAAASDNGETLLDRRKHRVIYEREDEYKRRRFDRMEHAHETEDQRMERHELEREEKRVRDLIEKQKQQNGHETQDTGDKTPPPPGDDGDRTPPPPADENDKTPPPAPESPQEKPKNERKRKRRWDVAPEQPQETPKKSRWDVVEPKSKLDIRHQNEPPRRPAAWGELTETNGDGERGQFQLEAKGSAASEGKRLSDEVLDQLLPQSGYEILEPPAWYVPVRNQNRQPNVPETGFYIPEANSNPQNSQALANTIPQEVPGAGELQFFKESDMKYFSKLLDVKGEDNLTLEEAKERKIMRLLLKIKNGTPPVRKVALRNLTDNARVFGAKALFEQILPLLMERDLEDQERHLLVKIIDRVLYRLGDLVRPFTHRILVVIEPLLIDEDYYARVEGQEIISNLSKAAGLAQMIKTMRPDVDSPDEYVRNTTARAFAVVASALGIQNLLPFVTAVCKSKRSGEARHTGAKIIQQIAILVGSGVLPHLNGLVDAVGGLLEDPQSNVRTIAANALAALAEVSAPYGIESFDSVLQPLWKGVRKQRGKNLAAFLKCIGFMIPLMDPEYANHYTRNVMEILKRNFSTPDEDMRRVVLKVVQQCAATEGVTPQYLREQVMPLFIQNFWTVRIARDYRSYRLVVESTVILAQKVGVSEILEQTVITLKHESHPLRKMGLETLDKIVGSLGAVDVPERLEERLIDGLLGALELQDDTNVDSVLLNAFGTMVNALGVRSKPYLGQIASKILYRLKNPSDVVREQAADLVTRIASVMKYCGEDQMMGTVSYALYECLGEAYPGALGSIIGAMNSIVSVVGLSSMNPPIRDLLPALTPILKNRHEKVQENAIDLVGRIADRGADMIAPKEWMRICHELLEMLRAHKKVIRKAANRTFGYIANAIGPQDVLAALLTGLRVQERQLRVCIAVAIGIVAETCLPFTVLPAVMNEYRVPEKHVQNGILKSLTFMFEYIGPMAKDYIYAIAPLLEDALMDRDQVHRQTAATVVKHIALNTVGLGLEDVMIHFLNMLLPNIFETSPHVINRILDGIDGVRNAVGPGVMLNYTWAGMFQAARKVRTPYWRMYNTCYVQQADAMVPYYPDLDEPQYQRPELDMWI